MTIYKDIEPSVEQKQFITWAKEGRNILVDACIGSGKTTAIQKLGQSLPSSTKILYLTYNKLLKLDAKSKITNRNVTVQNYHGFAYLALSRSNIYAGVSDLIQTVNREKPYIIPYDVMIIDEYQDIEQEIAEFITYIKEQNPKMQLIAVGDMEQKIYDKTTLDVKAFINTFLGDYTQMEFTQCFRLSQDIAAELGRIWGKEIKGVNPECEVETMSMSKAITYLASQDPEDIMCLGARTGSMSTALNWLEDKYPDKFNKHTVYASIADVNQGATIPDTTSAIFTTFDSSKGMERDVCVIFDYDEAYWGVRSRKAQQKYEILRNIFLVAASRGKKRIIFVAGDKPLLTEKTLSTPTKTSPKFEGTTINGLFAFKYKEDIERAYKLLDISRLKSKTNDYEPINIRTTDGLIDLSPCISIYQQASYFTNYDLDQELDMLYMQKYNHELPDYQRRLPLEDKILLATSIATNQWRYRTQVSTPFISKTDKKLLFERLSTMFNRDMIVQKPAEIQFFKNRKLKFSAVGFADIIQNDTVYMLHYTQTMTHEAYLECACYMYALGLDYGIVWNIQDNTQYEIYISNKEQFMNTVATAATKGAITKFEHK